MQQITSSLHSCNYYCEPDNDTHAIIIIGDGRRSREQIEDDLRLNIGSDLISMRPAPEMPLEEARKQVHYRGSKHHTQVFLAICKGRKV